MRLILTRHGETIGNKKEIIQGHMPGTLTKNGISQAKKVAARLAKEKVAAIYSSDLKRAKDTAQEIAKHHPKVRIIFTQDLRERNWGSFEGKPYLEISGLSAPSDVEMLESMYHRANQILTEAYKKYPKETVIFVGHGGINRIIIAAIMKKHHSWEKKVTRQSNTAVNIFEITEGKKHKKIVFNCTKHLD